MFMRRYQQGGQQGDMMQQIAAMLQEGTPPKQVLQMLIQQGMPQDQAMQALQGVMQQMQGGQEEAPEETPVMQRGGFVPLRTMQQGGKYSYKESMGANYDKSWQHYNDWKQEQATLKRQVKDLPTYMEWRNGAIPEAAEAVIENVVTGNPIPTPTPVIAPAPSAPVSQTTATTRTGIVPIARETRKNTTIVQPVASVPGMKPASKTYSSIAAATPNSKSPAANTTGHPGLDKFLNERRSSLKSAPARTYMDTEGRTHVEGDDTGWVERQTNMQEAGRSMLGYRPNKDNPMIGLADAGLTYLHGIGNSVARVATGKGNVGDYVGASLSAIPLVGGAARGVANQLSKIPLAPAVRNAAGRFTKPGAAFTKGSKGFTNYLMNKTAANIKQSASKVINETEGMQPQLASIYKNLNKAEIPFVNQKQANILYRQTVQQAEEVAAKRAALEAARKLTQRAQRIGKKLTKAEAEYMLGGLVNPLKYKKR